MTNRSASRRPAAPVKIGVASLALAFCAAAHAQENAADSISEQVERVFKDRQDAVVQIESTDQRGERYGTGFFTDPAGMIYTLAAIVAGADQITVIQGDRKFPAKLLIADPRSGIALLKADCDSPFIPLGDASTLEVASPVMAIGYASNGIAPSWA